MDWFVQICLAVKYHHNKKILHKNIQTKNIYLTKNKVIKVGKIALPERIDLDKNLGCPNSPLPFYLAPEVI